ncbi:MAG: hypothetical protein MJZ37_05900 [Bacilli bacterium]|nr:hypothetical protein [Bacilli bacterium]
MTFKEHLLSWMSEKEIEDLISSLNEEKSKHAVLLNTNKISDESFLEMFPNVNPHPIVKHAYLYDKDEYDLGKNILHDLGAYYLQDPSAMCVSYLLGINRNEKILDLCAAPGGKTVQASMALDGTGLLISNDLSHQRAGLILQNVERLGLGNVVITNNDFSAIYQDYQERFDKIILDAPCSGSGMFRKQREMEEDWSYQKVLKFAEIQKELIKIAYSMLKKGGKLIYSTCSFSEEEDECVVEELLKNTDAKLLDIDNDYFVVSKKHIGVHLLPNVFPGEGHYIALIEKPGELNPTAQKQVKFKANKYVSSLQDIYVNRFGDSLFYLQNDDAFKKLSVIRKGVKLGEISGDILKYDHHYATFVSQFDNELEIDLQSAIKYLSGESLNIPSKRGFILLKYKGINLDIAKSDGNIIKNRYPKYLRKKISQ